MAWLLLVALVLGALGLWLLARARFARRETGLPAGRVSYVDTGAWDRCERPLFSSRRRLTGRPDYLVQSSEGLIPVEVKSGVAPAQPYPAHLLQLLQEPLLAAELGRRGRRWVQRHASVDTMVGGYEQLLATLYERKTGRPLPPPADAGRGDPRGERPSLAVVGG